MTARFYRDKGITPNHWVISTDKNWLRLHPLSGHLNPMTALARKLQSRGHEVSFISVLDAGPIVRAANLNFVPISEKEYPLGSIPEVLSGLSKLNGLDVIEYWIKHIAPGLAAAGLGAFSENTGRNWD